MIWRFTRRPIPPSRDASKRGTPSPHTAIGVGPDESRDRSPRWWIQARDAETSQHRAKRGYPHWQLTNQWAAPTLKGGEDNEVVRRLSASMLLADGGSGAHAARFLLLS